MAEKSETTEQSETDNAIEEMLNSTSEEAQSEEVDEAQKEEIDWKSKARLWESRSKENKEKADKADELTTKVDELTAALNEANTKVTNSDLEITRWKVAAKHGISEEDAELFLVGTDEETLNKQAERLSQTSRTPKPDAAQGNRGGTGEGLTPKQQGAASLSTLFN